MQGSFGADVHFDDATLARLHEDAGADVELTNRLAATYVQRSQELLLALEAAVAVDDLDAVRTTAHNLRSTSALVGARSVHELAATLEAPELDAGTARRGVERLRQLLPPTVEAITAFAASL